MSHNLSWNCGMEGPTDDPVLELRGRQVRNFLATLLLSQGVPMISHGDELGRTQQGNNNAYCHDSELTWINWNLSDDHKARYFQGRAIRGGDVKDMCWFAPDGCEMTDEAWNADFVRSFGMLLSGMAIEEVDERGAPIIGDTLLILLYAHDEKVPFTLPPLELEQQWHRVFDTMGPHTAERAFKAGVRYPLQGRSLALFKVVPPVHKRRRLPAYAQHSRQQQTDKRGGPVPVGVEGP